MTIVMTNKTTTKKATTKSTKCRVNDQVSFLQDAITDIYHRYSELRNASIDLDESILLWKGATIVAIVLSGISLIWLFLK